MRWGYGRLNGQTGIGTEAWLRTEIIQARNLEVDASRLGGE
jgi:hypothetical protein